MPGFFLLATTIASLLGVAVAPPPPQNPPWPNSYFALGDSFSAGIGSGHFYHPDDIANKKCKRFDRSYPAIAIQTSIFQPVLESSFRFLACSGNVLDDLDGQRAGLGKAEVITLSISGNDFDFAPVVKACVYDPRGTDAGCDAALNAAEVKVNDQSIWDKYKAKVQAILANNMVDDKAFQLFSVLVITGYPKFFATPVPNDVCSNNGFPIFPLVTGLKLRNIVRSRMNNAVAAVNRKIQEQIVPINSQKIKFIDLDALFEGHRFCEPGKTTMDAAVGANDANTWFISIGTDMQETEWIPAGTVGEQPWQDVGNPLNELHQNSVFHPKENGHINTANQLFTVIAEFARDNGHTQGTAGTCTAGQAPKADCQQLPWGDLTANIDLAHIPCYQNGNRRWCNIVTHGSCQAVVGWDVTDNGGKLPGLTQNMLKTYVDEQLNNAGDCVGKTLQFPEACTETVPRQCMTGALYCLTAVGTDCKPGAPV